MDISFTRWACLQLDQYDKILQFDADVLIFSNIDELFALEAPAGMFTTPWAAPFKRGGIFNPYVDAAGAPLGHGATVSSAMVQRAISDSNSFVLIGNCVLLKPDRQLWADFKRYVLARQPFGSARINSGKDEQSLAMFFTEERPEVSWRMIHQKFAFIPWHAAWLPEGAGGIGGGGGGVGRP